MSDLRAGAPFQERLMTGPLNGLMAAALLLLAVLAVPAPCAAAASDCDRTCLESTAGKYQEALLAHDPKRAPLAANARYTENGVELTLPDGIWRTLGTLEPYRLLVADPAQKAVGFFLKGEENGAPVLIATRLRVVDRGITQIESVVARVSGTLGGFSFGGAHVDQLGASPRAQFLTPLPPDKRRTRGELAAIVNTYFTGIENNTGDKPPAFAEDCHRLEDGTATTNVPTPSGATPGAMNLGCAAAFALGYYHEDTRMRNRRILAVDEERGLVYTGIFLDHDATVRSYTLKDGRTNTVRNTGPWTWMAHEIFQVNADGKISQVEAILLSVPYGMRPGWSEGVHLPSPQAQKDHFREY